MYSLQGYNVDVHVMYMTYNVAVPLTNIRLLVSELLGKRTTSMIQAR